jgi:aryl-alcohol dehydrogenase-like predicted oxidoreductase
VRHEVKEHSLERLTAQWQESQQQLGSFLRLYQIHSATLESGVLANQSVLSALAKLRATNGVAIGLSLSGPQQAATLARALTVTVDGVRLFDCVQATWNLLERAAGAVLQEAHAAGMRVIVKEALANGRLTERNHTPDFAKQMALLRQIADEADTTIDAVALAFVLAQPWVDVVLSGATTVAQVRSNLAAQAVDWQPTFAQMLDPLAETPEAYWTTRSALPWN